MICRLRRVQRWSTLIATALVGCLFQGGCTIGGLTFGGFNLNFELFQTALLGVIAGITGYLAINI